MTHTAGLRIATLTLLTMALAACSSPPEAPQVDDSQKRPVNDPAAIALQSCRSELSASKVVLTETLARQPVEAPVRLLPASTSSANAAGSDEARAPGDARATSNTIFIVHFEVGASELNLSPQLRDDLISKLREAKYVVIRGRTDAIADTPLQTNLAKRRALAAFDFVTGVARFPAEGIRVTWQGAGDQAVAGDGVAQRLANRRVELELYSTPPRIDIAAR